MVNLTENLRMVKLYCENQGDKFHPMSDEFLEDVLDAPGSETQKSEQVRVLCEKFSSEFPYHVGQILGYLEYDEDED